MSVHRELVGMFYSIFGCNTSAPCTLLNSWFWGFSLFVKDYIFGCNAKILHIVYFVDFDRIFFMLNLSSFRCISRKIRVFFVEKLLAMRNTDSVRQCIWCNQEHGNFIYMYTEMNVKTTEY